MDEPKTELQPLSLPERNETYNNDQQQNGADNVLLNTLLSRIQNLEEKMISK